MLKRGQIYITILQDRGEFLYRGKRPVLLMREVGDNCIVLPITSKHKCQGIVSHTEINSKKYRFLKKDSVVVGEQVMIITKDSLKDYLGSLSDTEMGKVSESVYNSFISNKNIKGFGRYRRGDIVRLTNDDLFLILQNNLGNKFSPIIIGCKVYEDNKQGRINFDNYSIDPLNLDTIQRTLIDDFERRVDDEIMHKIDEDLEVNLCHDYAR